MSSRKKRTTEYHGHAIRRTRTYATWRGMRNRCCNPKVPEYPYYGGRGITHCAEWASFSCFLRDMGERPVGLSLDRIDNDKGYSKENCRWATPEQQSNNKRGLVIYTFNGMTLCRSAWERRLGLNRGTILNRLHGGWTVEEALSCPLLSPIQIQATANRVKWFHKANRV